MLKSMFFESIDSYNSLLIACISKCILTKNFRDSYKLKMSSQTLRNMDFQFVKHVLKCPSLNKKILQERCNVPTTHPDIKTNIYFSENTNFCKYVHSVNN